MLYELGINELMSLLLILPVVSVVLGCINGYYFNRLYIGPFLSLFLPIMAYPTWEAFVDQFSLNMVYIMLYFIFSFLSSFLTYYTLSPNYKNSEDANLREIR